MRISKRLPGWFWWTGAIALAALLILILQNVLDDGEQTATEVTATIEAVIAADRPSSTTTPIPATPSPLPTGTMTTTPSPTATATSTLAPSSTFTPVPNLPPPDPEAGTVWQRPQDGMRMIFVPPGTFPMGSDEGGSNEIPVHDVTLDGFWIDETEVTNAQYNQCVESGTCETSSYADDPTFNGNDYPVVGVSWYDADSYCRSVDGRLPTEAEWEYAARGPGALFYPWSNEFDGTLANFCDANSLYSPCDEGFVDGYNQTAPVGSFPDGASWIGALDMAGNAREWVNDWYGSEYYTDSPDENPTGPEGGSRKVMRGG